MRLARCREIDDSGVHHSLQCHFLTPWILLLVPFADRKTQLARSRKLVFKETTGRKCHFSLLKAQITILMCLAKTFSPSFRYHFLPLLKKKNNLVAVVKAMNHGVRNLRKLIYCVSAQSKMRFGGCRIIGL
jgi:hypothetical protein